MGSCSDGAVGGGAEALEEDKLNTTQGSSLPLSAEDELRRLEGQQHYHKMRNTILALVDARLATASEETVWARPDTCSRKTWHVKWKHNPVLMDVLAAVERQVREWRDGEELRALREAARALALASPEAAEQLARMAATGRVRRLSGDGTLTPSFEDASAGDVRLAAMAVLDRAGKETASKSSMQVEVTSDDLAAAREEARRYREGRGLVGVSIRPEEPASSTCGGGGD